MYSSVAQYNSGRNAHIFSDLKGAYSHGCRVERDWLLYQRSEVQDDGTRIMIPEPRRPVNKQTPTRWARISTTLHDGTEHSSTIPVFHFNETRESPRTQKRTIALVSLHKLYRSDYHQHIHWEEDTRKSPSVWKWKTLYYAPNGAFECVASEKRYQGFVTYKSRYPFGFQEFKSHVYGGDIFGGFASGETSYVVFDIDFHEPIFEIQPCLDVVRLIWNNIPKLIQQLGGYGLHAQIKNENVDGIHGLFFLHKRIDSKEVEAKVREFAVALERNNPELLLARRNRCHTKTPTDWSRIHFIDKIGPNGHHGFRLPFCRGRQMIIDDLLPCQDGKHDLVRFVDWQEQCRRQHWTNQKSMPTEDVVEIVRKRFKAIENRETFSPALQAAKESSLTATQLKALSSSQDNWKEQAPTRMEKKRRREEGVFDSISLVSPYPPLSPVKTAPSSVDESLLRREEKLQWKGNAKRIIVETFTGQLVVPKSLDEISCFLARLSDQFNDSDDEAVERFSGLLEMIPEETASELSSRLADGEYEAVVKVFESKLQRLAKGKLSIERAEASASTLKKCCTWWTNSGFNPFVPKTWTKAHPLHRREIRDDLWTPDDKMDFCQQLIPILGRSAKWVDPIHLVNVCLYWVRRKEREENGMSLKYWRIMLEGELQIPCGNKSERRHQQIKNGLIDLGVIQQTVKPMFGYGKGLAARYAPGWRSKARGEFPAVEELEMKLLGVVEHRSAEARTT